MAGERDYNLRHLFVQGRVSGEQFTRPPSRVTFRTPQRDRATHAAKLQRELDAVRQRAGMIKDERLAAGITTDFGIIIEFASNPDYPLKADSLERRASGIQLLNLRRHTAPSASPAGETTEVELATVRVPYGKLDLLARWLDHYRTEKTKSGHPKHKPLIESIESIRQAALEAFWTDESPMPASGVEAWWEAWLHTGTKGEDRHVVQERFETAARAHNIEITPERINLPEHTVLLIQGKREQLGRSLDLLNCLAELRRPQVSAELFAGMEQEEQAEWVGDLCRHLRPPSPLANAVCLLDSGINHEHPLLAPLVPPDGLQAYKPSWTTADDLQRPHGTMMAGVAAFGNLADCLVTPEPSAPAHWIESVKMIRSGSPHEPHLYGDVTLRCVSRIEIAAPKRPRVFSMQVTDEGTGNRGRPTSWSAALDAPASGYGEEETPHRLLFVSAGNVELDQAQDYPSRNETEGVHDPGQAWNVVTVGGYTDKAGLSDPKRRGWRPLAPRGGLAPASSTSRIWNHDWPLKPDVVLEAGNRITEPDSGSVDCHGELELLTTNANWRGRLLTTTGDTSAATVQAARFAVLIQAEYPDFWPETIRALLVHSAGWTPAMLSNRQRAQIGKREWRTILRTYGFGVPHLPSAVRSARSSTTLICQDSLQPYEGGKGRVGTKLMRLHDLPWPKEELQALGETPVEMRVTLSYFVEPNPGPRFPTNRYRYASSNLRFDVRRATESVDEFRARINAAARSEENDGSESTSDSSDWLIGT